MTNNKDYLSQEEIDALLKQASDDQDGTGGEMNVNDYLTPLEQDALGEIGNITFGSAATALSTLLGKKVDITTPQVSAIAKKDLEKEFPKPHVAVHVRYVEGFEGINLLVIKTEDAQVIADLMLGGDGKNISGELNEIHISAVQEAMNQMMGSAATSMSTMFNRLVNISPPGIDIMDISANQGMENIPNEDVFVKVSFRITIEDLIDSTIMQLLPVEFTKNMVEGLMGGGNASNEPAAQAQTAQPAAQETPAQPVQEQPVQRQQPPVQQPIPEQPGYQQPPNAVPGFGAVQHDRNVNVQPVQYASFSPESAVYANNSNLDLLLDIPLRVTVELGRTKRQIREILDFTQGSIIELDKLAGEPVDILVNNKLIARGEVVVIDENFGVRITDIISKTERIQKLQ